MATTPLRHFEMQVDTDGSLVFSCNPKATTQWPDENVLGYFGYLSKGIAMIGLVALHAVPIAMVALGISEGLDFFELIGVAIISCMPLGLFYFLTQPWVAIKLGVATEFHFTNDGLRIVAEGGKEGSWSRLFPYSTLLMHYTEGGSRAWPSIGFQLKGDDERAINNWLSREAKMRMLTRDELDHWLPMVQKFTTLFKI